MDEKKTEKKNPCPDCQFCQYCSDNRCAMCRPKAKDKEGKGKPKKPHQPLFRMY